MAVSNGRSGCGCSRSSHLTCFRTDGGDGAVADFDGSVAAPLVDFCVGLIFIYDLYYIVYFCVLLLASFSLVASLCGVLPVK